MQQIFPFFALLFCSIIKTEAFDPQKFLQNLKIRNATMYHSRSCMWIKGQPSPTCTDNAKKQYKPEDEDVKVLEEKVNRIKLIKRENEDENEGNDKDYSAGTNDEQLMSERNFYKEKADGLIEEINGMDLGSGQHDQGESVKKDLGNSDRGDDTGVQNQDPGPKDQTSSPTDQDVGKDQLVSERNYYQSQADGLLKALKEEALRRKSHIKPNSRRSYSYRRYHHYMD